MKQTIIICLLLSVIFGCKDKAKIANLKAIPVAAPPHAVHNTCADIWAVKTPEGYFGKLGRRGLSERWHVAEAFFKEKDTINFSVLGDEFQYSDSAAAMNSYNGYVLRRIIAYQVQEDKKRRDDSLFKCKHSYE